VKEYSSLEGDILSVSTSKEVSVMKHLRMALIYLVLAAPTVVSAADYPGSYSFLYGAVQNFKWTEMLPNGSKFLDESGVLYGLGIDMKHSSRSSSLFTLMKCEAFFGQVDYDGHVQAGYPAKSDSTYFGMDVEGGIGFHVGNEKALLAPFVELGWKWWSRDIADSTYKDNTGTIHDAIGYSELWSMYFAKAGVWGSASLSQSSFASIEAGVLFPLYTKNDVSLAGVKLEPKGQPSPFAEVGISIKNFRLAAYYESLRFDKSPIVRGVFQPESKMDIFGGRIGVSF
jgi:hypothetical protein